ncbi:hypothetical protein HDE_05819 [Halotydeus destructor]|nr:hypothetical protein HDE_05819 [Halotydeus destructor]
MCGKQELLISASWELLDKTQSIGQCVRLVSSEERKTRATAVPSKPTEGQEGAEVRGEREEATWQGDDERSYGGPDVEDIVSAANCICLRAPNGQAAAGFPCRLSLKLRRITERKEQVEEEEETDEAFRGEPVQGRRGHWDAVHCNSGASCATALGGNGAAAARAVVALPGSGGRGGPGGRIEGEKQEEKEGDVQRHWQGESKADRDQEERRKVTPESWNGTGSEMQELCKLSILSEARNIELHIDDEYVTTVRCEKLDAADDLVMYKGSYRLARARVSNLSLKLVPANGSSKGSLYIFGLLIEVRPAAATAAVHAKREAAAASPSLSSPGMDMMRSLMALGSGSSSSSLAFLSSFSRSPCSAPSSSVISQLLQAAPAALSPLSASPSMPESTRTPGHDSGVRGDKVKGREETNKKKKEKKKQPNEEHEAKTERREENNQEELVLPEKEAKSREKSALLSLPVNEGSEPLLRPRDSQAGEGEEGEVALEGQGVPCPVAETNRTTRGRGHLYGGPEEAKMAKVAPNGQAVTVGKGQHCAAAVSPSAAKAASPVGPSNRVTIGGKADNKEVDDEREEGVRRAAAAYCDYGIRQEERSHGDEETGEGEGRATSEAARREERESGAKEQDMSNAKSMDRLLVALTDLRQHMDRRFHKLESLLELVCSRLDVLEEQRAAPREGETRRTQD